jgi:2-polyprenyl-3-methyl-5-hydroxy-6-metoxy-1,4-benzoquinol methylase
LFHLSFLSPKTKYEPVLKTLLSRAGYEAKGYDINFFPDEGLNSTYDLVISTETFEHFREPGKELKEIKALLSPKGYLTVMTRHYPLLNGKADLESFKNWYYQRDPTHICFYSTKTFEWIAKSNGYKLLYDDEKDFIILQVQS